MYIRIKIVTHTHTILSKHFSMTNLQKKLKIRVMIKKIFKIQIMFLQQIEPLTSNQLVLSCTISPASQHRAKFTRCDSQPTTKAIAFMPPNMYIFLQGHIYSYLPLLYLLCTVNIFIHIIYTQYTCSDHL